MKHVREIERRAAAACLRASDLCQQAYHEQGRGSLLRQASAAIRAASADDLTRLAILRARLAALTR